VFLTGSRSHSGSLNRLRNSYLLLSSPSVFHSLSLSLSLCRSPRRSLICGRRGRKRHTEGKKENRGRVSILCQNKTDASHLLVFFDCPSGLSSLLMHDPSLSFSLCLAGFFVRRIYIFHSQLFGSLYRSVLLRLDGGEEV
jgi:hypothetical protein